MIDISIITPEPYLNPENKAIADINFKLNSFYFSSPIQYNYNETENYVEAVIKYESYGIILNIEITKFLDEAIGYSVISRSSDGDFSTIEYYIENLSKTVSRHINTFKLDQYLKTLSKYE